MRSDKHSKHNKKKKTRKKLRRILLGLVLFSVLAAGTLFGYYTSSLNHFFKNISDGSGNAEEITEQDLRLKELKPFSILMMGVDLADQGQQRTDTLMVATVNPEEESVKLLSIPRDTVVTTDAGFVEKINAMYTIGGEELVIDTVENLFDIPISFYAIVDFRGLVELVDAVGGITVDSPLEFTVQDSEENSDAIKIEEGLQELNGEHALGYARMRKQDPRGDFGRQERQQEVIQSILDELISFSTLTNLNNILSSVSPYMRTNITGRQILTIAANYKNSAQNIDSLVLKGGDNRMYFPHYGKSVYVFEPHSDSLMTVKNELRSHLDLAPASYAGDQSLLLEQDLNL